MYNRTIICGRLTKKPELLVSSNNIEYTRLTIAINSYSRDGGNKVSYVDATAWRNNAINISKFLDKGSMVLIDGQLRNDRNGGLFLSVSQVQFLDKKKTSAENVESKQEATTKIIPESPTNDASKINFEPEAKTSESESTDDKPKPDNTEPTINWDEE